MRGLVAIVSTASLAAFLSIAAAPPPVGSLTVRIANVRNAKGQIHIDICSQASFLEDNCPYAAFAPAHEGVTTVVARGIPAGQYAVQAFHDENTNHKVDRTLFGIPREGVGFSNDAPIRLGPPTWAAAKFAFAGADQTIQLKMRYFIGAAGPRTR